MPPQNTTKTASGQLEGRERGGVLLFAGIPYAEPPLGEKRFLPPSPAPAWQGVRSARRFGLAAPQRPGVGLTAAALDWDEDCLTLNVCTPAVDDGARPVLVWIHGGAFRTGKGGIPWYDGTSFARLGDIVTVSINYRLGVLGYAHVGDVAGDAFGSSGLTGLLDQIAALKWVRDNIAAFGGDPSRVTIAGESAGAMSVGALLGCPAAEGLFHGAIAQSGAAHHTLTDAASREIGRDVAELLGAVDAAGLQNASVEQILDAQEQVQLRFAERNRGGSGALSDMAFQPAVGCPTLPEAPIDAIRKGHSSRVPLLCGTNLDETTLWGYGKVDEDRLHRFAGRMFGDRADDAVATYRQERPSASPSSLVIAMTTDQIFRIPAIRLCEAHSEQGGDTQASSAGPLTWSYLFTWPSSAYEGRLGATHALEVPFTFNTLRKPGVEAFLGKGGEDPQPLADAMHAAWISFVREGNPNSDTLGHAWDAYDSEHRTTLELGRRIEPLKDPYPAERLLWDGIR